MGFPHTILSTQYSVLDSCVFSSRSLEIRLTYHSVLITHHFLASAPPEITSETAPSDWCSRNCCATHGACLRSPAGPCARGRSACTTAPPGRDSAWSG